MQSRLSEFSHREQSVNFEGKKRELYRVLVSGSRLTQAAKVAKLPKSTAHKYVKQAVKQGILKRIAKWPALYSPGKQWAHSKVHTSVAGCERSPSKRFTPHKFGVTFYLMRRPLNGWKKFQGSSELKNRGQSKGWKRYFWREGDFTIEAYPNKVKIWCFAFSGNTPEEQRKNGIQRIQERRLQFQEEQLTKLGYDKILAPHDWIISHKKLSDYARAVLKLDNTPQEIANSMFVVDASHPGNVEIVGEGADKNVDTWDWLLTDGKPTLEHISLITKGNTNQLEANAKQIGDLTIQVGELLTFLKQKTK